MPTGHHPLMFKGISQVTHPTLTADRSQEGGATRLRADQGRSRCGTARPWAPFSLPAANSADGTGSHSGHLLRRAAGSFSCSGQGMHLSNDGRSGGLSPKGHQTCSCPRGGLLRPIRGSVTQVWGLSIQGLKEATLVRWRQGDPPLDT